MKTSCIHADKIEGLTYAKFANKRQSDGDTLSFKRASNSGGNSWRINQVVEVSDERQANTESLKLLNMGGRFNHISLIERKLGLGNIV